MPFNFLDAFILLGGDLDLLLHAIWEARSRKGGRPRTLSEKALKRARILLADAEIACAFVVMQ